MEPLVRFYPLLVFLLSLLTFCQPLEVAEGCFRAAVYEHDRVGEEPSLESIAKNIDIYRKVVKKAAKEGAEIVVFPEDGLFAPPDDRTQLKPYLEEIPDIRGQEVVNPCDESDKFSNVSILSVLSCLSKDNDIYLAANMGDIQACVKTEDTDCPSDGHYQYNTEVVFDNQGNLVAKYHKQHLFLEPSYDIPSKQEFVALNTSFGTLGLFICFDSIFKDPGVTLVEDYGVDTMLLTTWWFDEAPFLLAHQYQQGWSFTNRVNLLASNIKRLEKGSTGSGIYSGHKGALIYKHDIDGDFPELMVATLPKSSKSGTQCDPNPLSFPMSDKKYENEYHRVVDRPKEYFSLLRLNDTRGVVSLCDNGFCCSLNYSVDSKALRDSYYLAVVNRTRSGGPIPYEWCEEMCALLAYNELNETYAQTASTSFEFIHLKATFSTKYVYPSVLLNYYHLAPTADWTFDEDDLEVELVVSNSDPVIVSGLYGRCYDRDPPYSLDIPDNGSNSAESALFISSYLFLCLLLDTLWM